MPYSLSQGYGVGPKPKTLEGNSMNTEELKKIIASAKINAWIASDAFFHDKLNGNDSFPCGFAWVELRTYQGKKIDGRSKIARILKEAGINQNWNRVFYLWNPAEFGCQNVDTLEAGATAAADVFKKHGFGAEACSRLD